MLDNAGPPAPYARAREELCIARNRKSPCWPGDSSDPCTVPDWNPKSTWGLARGFYVGEYKILVHRARVMSSVMRTIEKWPCLLGSGVFL